MSEEKKSTSPDLSRIINVIMENPKLIEEISALAKAEEEKTFDESAKEVSAPAPAEAVSVSEPTYSNQNNDGVRARRSQLFSALKPFLSNERQKAVDSMMTFADILDTMRGR